MLSTALVALAVLYAALCLLVFLGQRALMYPAPRAPIPLPSPAQGVHRVGGGVVLYRPGPAGAPVVVHFHGNAEQLLDVADFADELVARGVGVLAVEYPGYGWAPGAPTEEGLYAAGAGALEWLAREQGVGPERVVLSGRSLGAAVAAEMAHRGRGARLVLLAPFLSMVEMARETFRWLPGALLMRDRYDTLGKAPGIQVPVLLVHGEEDTLIPADHARALSRVLPRAELVLVPGAGHNDLLERPSDREHLLTRIADFARTGATPTEQR